MALKPEQIGVLQLNPTVGAVEANALRIMEGYRQLVQQGVALVVTAECALTGYPPEDLLLWPDFGEAVNEALEAIKKEVSIPLILGSPIPLPGAALQEADRPGWQNCTLIFESGQETARYSKRVLPNYGVFDEHRWFRPGDLPGLHSLCIDGETIHVGLTICEDIWSAGLRSSLPNCDLLLNLSASPYSHGKRARRIEELTAAKMACQAHTALYVNQYGGQDELVFDGRSLILTNESPVRQLPDQETVCTMASASPCDSEAIIDYKLVYSLLVQATRDYVHKSGFKKVLVGLSGGIDSALVLAIAVDALGADQVNAYGLPSQYNSAETRSDGQKQADLLGVSFQELPIGSLFDSSLKVLEPVFGDAEWNLAEENMQARLRGLLLMAVSNKTNALLLTTGNKSEYAVGYATLYGDMNGAFAPIKDLYKTQVFALSEWLNQQGRADIIVPSIITRPPSAELRPEQRDDQSLPPYDILDRFLMRWIDARHPLAECTFDGFDLAQAKRWARAIRLSEYKRRQAPPGPKLTRTAFGRERRLPIVNGFEGQH